MQLKEVFTLTEKWKVLAISTIDSVIDEMDNLTGGHYSVCIQRWETTKNNAHPDYAAKNFIKDAKAKYFQQARGCEKEILNINNYYPRPEQLFYTIDGIGSGATIGSLDTEYQYYVYLSYPVAPDIIKFRDQEIVYNKTPSRAIKVNQIGYLPKEVKVAHVGWHIPSYGPLQINSLTFNLIDLDQSKIVFQGPLVLRDLNTSGKNGLLMTGEITYECDFSIYPNEGNYCIEVIGIGRSWPFKISNDIYDQVFQYMRHGFYNQRCGVPIKSNWPRPACHLKPVYESKNIQFPPHFQDRPANYERFDVVGATTDHSMQSSVVGGWHDAADWDKNSMHYACIFDMLYAQELNPDLNLIEEINHGLRVWKASLTSKGGMSGAVETWTHPTIDADVEYTFGQRTRWDSLLFSAAASMMAEFTSDPKTRDTWKWFAHKTYMYGSDPNNCLGKIKIPAKTNRGTGTPYFYLWEEKEEHIAPFLLHAKARLYKLTKDSNYLANINKLALPKVMKYPYTDKDYSAWLLYGLVDLYPDQVKKYFIDFANKLVNQYKTSQYRSSWPKDQDYFMAWGESCLTNHNRALAVAYHITGNKIYKDVSIANLDFMLGNNPMGICWTTGLGSVYPRVIQHEISQKYYDPVAGITIYGPTGGSYKYLKDEVWNKFIEPDLPVWRTWSPHPTLNTGQCEFTIHETMSSMLFASSQFTNKNYQPKEIRPRAYVASHLP